MKQLTRDNAETIATTAAKKAIGFTFDPSEIKKRIAATPADQLVESMLRMMSDAAIVAFELAGCLDQTKKRERDEISRAASAAQNRHDRWKKATGAAF